MVAFILSLASLIFSVAVACYLLGPDVVLKASRTAYREIKHISGNVARRGPRPALLWAVVFIFLAIGYRVQSGADLPDAATLGALMGSATAAGGMLAYLRSLDYKNGTANEPGGLVNQVAIS